MQKHSIQWIHKDSGTEADTAIDKRCVFLETLLKLSCTTDYGVNIFSTSLTGIPWSRFSSEGNLNTPLAWTGVSPR